MPRSNKKAAKAEVRAMLVVLCCKFPGAFVRYERKRRPLKIGIFDYILVACPDLNPKHLQAALRQYTHNRGYVDNAVKGAPRIDLDGNPAGFVSQGDAAHAARVRLAIGRKAFLRRKAKAKKAAAAPSR